MAKKLQVSGNFLSEGFHLLGIASNLSDYRLCHFINERWSIGLKKYGDFAVEPVEEGFSWYFYYDDHWKTYYYLMANRNAGGFLKKEWKQFDYLLILKGSIDSDLFGERIRQLRQIPQVIGVFQQDLQKTKNMDVFLEALEMHELHEIIIPSKPQKYPFKS
ncbi:MAG: IPExxxVDY family protein [Bacteroidales bacterium]|nr:IPExxxVDY family protein [Bacteroidales bacterium]